SIKKKFTISGYITDSKSGERLFGASVYLPGRNRGTTSNTYGFFSLTLEPDTIELHVTYTGYAPYAVRVRLQSDVFVDVRMDTTVAQSQIVVVSSDGKSSPHTRTSGKVEVKPSFIRSVPAFLGEADVMRSLQMLPGIQGGNEGSSGLNVRGGSADQNLILLDGVPVYNASHAFAMFSVFNADAVNHVDILKSAFPASYGGRLSSVIDVHMKEGDKNKFHGEGGLGALFSKLTLEGPIRKGRSSFLVSGRRTYVDLLLLPFVKLAGSETEVVPYFADFNAKANFPLGAKDHIYFSLYSGKDKFRVKDRYRFSYDTTAYNLTYNSGFSWGNITAMARWNHVFSRRMFSNFTFTYSRYRFNILQEEERQEESKDLVRESSQEYFSGIRDWNVKGDIDFYVTPEHFIRGGFSATLHHYRPGVSTFFEKDSIVRVNTRVDNHSLYSGEYDLYLEDDIRVSHKMKLNVGVRLSAFSVTGTIFTALQPRINWLYRFTNDWSVKASYGHMNQFIHLLTNSNLALPTDLWLPVTSRVPPQSSHQYAAGVFYSRSGLQASVEMYYKKLKNVIEYAEGAGFSNAYDNWEDMVEVGSGRTYGIEWLFQKTTGKVTGLLSYTLGRSERKFSNINDGRPFPYKYDRRHEVKTAMIWQPSPRFELSGNWVYSTGTAISLPIAYYFDPATYSYIDIYNGRNNFRMPDYHRLDVSLRFIRQRKRYQRSWVISIYNAYNKFNPFFRYKEYTLDNKIVFKDMAVFPVVPSISYQFKF
ncbi:MAG TPA: TonB-dependent receptor, partial [Flavisolibacter sp.]